MKQYEAIMVVTHDRRMVEDFDRIFEVHDGQVVPERDNARRKR